MQEIKSFTDYRLKLHDRILDAALLAFGKYGVKTVKMDDIAKQLGISKRTLYEIYDTKEQVVFECIKRYYDKKLEELKEFEGNGLRDVLDVILFLYQNSIRESELLKPVIFEEIRKYPKIVEYLEQYKMIQETHYFMFVTRGIDEGYFRRDLNYNIIHHLFEAMKERVQKEHLLDDYSFKELVYNVMLVTLRGMCTSKGIKKLDLFLKEFGEKERLSKMKMTGVILAAGMAKRLRPLTDTKPKCLLKVGERTLLERTVDAMVMAGVSEFVVVTGYRAEMIRDFLAEKFPELVFRFLDNTDYENNNNIYSLWMAGQVVRGRDFLLMDSDILCDPAAVVRIGKETEPALAVNRHELGEEEMKVVVDDEGRITEICKTCRPEDAMGESVGIEKITAEYSEALYKELDEMILREGLIDIFYERAFERLIPQGFTFRVVDTTDYFSYELDTPEDFQRAQELMPAELL